MLSPDQAAALTDGTLDLGLLRPLPDSPASRSPICARRACWWRCRRTTRFAGRRRVRIADLDGEGLVIHAGSGRSAMNAMIQELFDSAGIRSHIAHEVAETSTLVTFVAAGLGLAIVPEPTAALAVPGVVYVPLTGTPGVELVAATRAGDESPLLTRALAILAGLSTA